MNHIELNAILYYADFLSLKEISQPVTDNCKYFYVHGVPMNSLFILDLEPIYDERNQYFQQAKIEYELIKSKYGEEGVESFIDDVCCIRACGSVDAERMLKCIHQYSNKKQRKEAFKNYYEWKENQYYSHITINEDGDPQEKQCTSYVYHVERMLGRPLVQRDLRTSGEGYEGDDIKPLL